MDSDKLFSTFGFWICFLVILGGVLLFSLIILINKLWKRQTVISAGEETTAAPVDLVSADHTSSSLSTNINGCRYEVFLSFRGLDTRYSFTDHLYTALVDADIHTFRDDNEIRMGQDLSSELLNAIQQSRISIPVFSTNYASSKWCLIELTKMVECKQKLNQIVLPIFYDVEPSNVRHQRGTYAKAFREHEKRVDKKIVKEWREALNVAASLKGYNVKNRHEAELIKEVVEMVLLEREKTPLVTGDYLVGIGYHVKEMLKLLDVSSINEVRIVGIHGMGGIGKTTIAKAVYYEISCHFKSCSFIEDVRETAQQHKGQVQLQRYLISNVLKLKDVDISSDGRGVNMIKERCCDKKVLIVLDDVDNLKQLRALANKRDWFGLGSRIIITTRDKDILDKHAVDKVYEPGELDHYQSLKLFSMHAFGRDRPPNDHYCLSLAIAQTTGGLPLALEVLGSHLSDSKPKVVWEDALKKLKKIPTDKVQTKLKISYDVLEYEQKQIFLDVACFFIGMNKRIATYFWDDCEYFPQEGIDILLRRSLVKLGENDKLKMHSQLRDLGREIVRRENFKEPGKRSRLWFHDIAWEVLKTHTGTREVEGLCLDFRNGLEENFLTKEEFAGISALKLLQIDYAIIAGDFKHLLSQLRWLSWKGCPYNFTATNFHPEKLIVLDLSHSKITEEWEGWHQIKIAKKLKFINLSGCCDLIKTPDFSAFPSLEELILENCRSLVEIDPSIGYLKHLVFLNVKDCQSLVDLPISICGLNSLESLIVSGCTELSGLPTGLGSLKTLRELRIDGTSMEQLPDPIALPEKLEILSARNCPYFTVLPTSIGQLRFLTELALDSSKIVMLPDSIGSLSKLRHLSLRGCRSLRKIPDSIGQLESVVNLCLCNAGVTEIPDSIGHLKSLVKFCLEGTQIIQLPNSVGLLSKLETLSLRFCGSLRRIPDSIGQLESLVGLNLSIDRHSMIRDSTHHVEWEGYCTMTQIVVLPDSIGSLFKLQQLTLGICSSLRKIPDLVGQLESLVYLRLYGTRVTKLPDSIGSLSMLQELSLRDCRSLTWIPDSIWRLESLISLHLNGTGIIEIPDSICELKSLEYLLLDDTEIIELPDSIGSLSMLKWLSLYNCGSLRMVPDSIGELKYLVDLQLEGTEIIELPDSIGSVSMLRSLSLRRCGSLKRIPNSICRLDSLCRLDLGDTRLIEIPDTIGHLKSLECLLLDGTQITELPDSICSLSKLYFLSLMHCRLLQKIPDSIWRFESLRWLKLDTTGIMDIPNANAMGNHRNVKDLGLDDKNGIDALDCWIADGEIPIDIGKLLPHSLTNLTLSSENSFMLPESISSLRLDSLDIRNCRNHPSLPHLPSTLSQLHISGCAMETLPNFSNLTNLWSLTVTDCENLLGIPSLSALSTLYMLSISNCRKLQRFPHLPSGLERLCLSSYMSLETEIPGLEKMKSLHSLDLSGCRSIKRLPNMSTMKALETLILTNCEKLCDIKGLERLESLEKLDVSGCISLERLPNLSNLMKLKELRISNSKKLIKIEGINKWVRIFGRTTISRNVKIKSAASVEHLKDEKFTDDQGIKRWVPMETRGRFKRLRSLETLYK